MFAPPVAKPTSAPLQRSAVAPHRPALAAAAPERPLEHTIRDGISARRERALENDDTAQETARSWTFGKIPVFSSGGTDRAQKPSLFAALRLPGPIQAKLRIGAANDPLEHEADRVADQVMRRPAPELSVAAAPSGILLRKCACGDHTGAAQECAECGKENNSLQRKANNVSVAALDIQHVTGQPPGEDDRAPVSVGEVLATPGSPLEPTLRQDMEQRFGHDFSQVRLHLDSHAAASAREVGALAYTVGRDVVFAQDQFAPHSADGRRLLAHELTHAVQQGAGNPAMTSDAGQAVLRRDSKRSPPAPPPKAPPPKAPAAKTAACPTDIKVASVDPLNDNDFGKNGWLTGWGAVVRMEVSDPDGKTWDGTEVHENLKQTKNTCGARAKDACSNKSGEGDSGGSTFKVGAVAKVQGKSMPAVKNSFYDVHIVARRDASILHTLGKADCEVQCHQFYDCGGKQIGPDFTITYSMKKDTVAGYYDVTRVTAKKEPVTKAAAPAAAPSGGGKS
jgi:hypothetical protein